MDGELSLIRKIEYLQKGDIITAYVFVCEKTDAYAEFNGTKYAETSNIREPFDFRLHTFDFNAGELHSVKKFDVYFTLRGKRKSNFFSETVTEIKKTVEFDESTVITLENAISRSDRGLRLIGISDMGSTVGTDWKIWLYATHDGAPVRVYTVHVDCTKAELIAGTPHAEPVFTPYDIQTVMDEALAVEQKGRHVVAASNADFFDMFGDCCPSGICVSGGKIVCGEGSPNPFFGITKSGSPVIEYPSDFDVNNLEEAVGGGQIIVRDGQISETAPLESFGDTPHPRTAFGIDADGNVIIMIVDGRRPVWSNGASLTELAKLMIANGAVRAINADGGGSSTIIVEKPYGLEMLNHPADLVRPMEDLVRPLFDSLIVVEK